MFFNGDYVYDDIELCFLPYMLIIFIMRVTRINLMCNKVYKESSGAPPTLVKMFKTHY